jgi:putative transposase
MRRHRVSERRACKVVGQHRSLNRYAPVPGDFEARLVAEMTKLAEANPRYGYRRVHALLVRDGWAINVKRVEPVRSEVGAPIRVLNVVDESPALH